MVDADLKYLRRLLEARLIQGPVLELGTGYGGRTCRALIEESGLRYIGTDVAIGLGVDFVANFERSDDMAVFRMAAPFGTVLIFNVLEHTFDPIRVLDNAATLVKPGGSLVVLTPAIWPLHNFPMDAWRVLPNFYEEYSKRRGMTLLNEHFEYVGFGPVKDYRNADTTYALPPPCESEFRRIASRVIHKVFNTFGRSMSHPSHVAVGAVLRMRDN